MLKVIAEAKWLGMKKFLCGGGGGVGIDTVGGKY